MAALGSSPATRLDCKERGPPGRGNPGENSPMLPARTTSVARLSYFSVRPRAEPAWRPPKPAPPISLTESGSAQNGSVVDALGALRDVPQIGIIMAKPDWDAVTVSAVAPAVVVTVGVRPAPYRKGAASCFSAADR